MAIKVKSPFIVQVFQTDNTMINTHNHPRSRRRMVTFITLALLSTSTSAQKSKRGFAYIGDTHVSDNKLLSSSSSPLSWYYNWSPYPNTALIPADSLEFVPMIHGIDSTQGSQTERAISSLPQSSTHLLSFNEPDGTKDSGGSAIKPEDAARNYIDYVVKYRTGEKGGGRKWKISHPATTGSGNGLNWLREFNTSCYKINQQSGCALDFVAAHWYGAFDGLASWVATLDEFYNKNQSRNPPLKIWITEMALPQQSAENTQGMMNASLPYLDKLENVEKYAWFGAFRTDDSNAWTGKGVSLFDGDGGLTALGALYMGGGYMKGQKGPGESAAAAVKTSTGAIVALGLCAVVFIML